MLVGGVASNVCSKLEFMVWFSYGACVAISGWGF